MKRKRGKDKKTKQKKRRSTLIFWTYLQPKIPQEMERNITDTELWSVV